MNTLGKHGKLCAFTQKCKQLTFLAYCLTFLNFLIASVLMPLAFSYLSHMLCIHYFSIAGIADLFLPQYWKLASLLLVD